MKKSLRGVIFDVDGILVWQKKVCPGAITTINALRHKKIPIRFLTNSSLRSRESCANELQSHNINAQKKEIITASYATANYLHSIKAKSYWIMLEDAGLNEFANFSQNEINPEYIVIGDNRTRFNFTTLNRILRLLLKGSKLIAMNSGLVDASFGEIELNTGSWIGMLERGAGVEAILIGKPASYCFNLAVKSLHLHPEQVLMVGDSITSDILGAHNAGLPAALIKQGSFKKSDLDNQIKPEYIYNSVDEILSLF